VVLSRSIQLGARNRADSGVGHGAVLIITTLLAAAASFVSAVASPATAHRATIHPNNLHILIPSVNNVVCSRWERFSLEPVFEQETCSIREDWELEGNTKGGCENPFVTSWFPKLPAPSRCGARLP